MLSNFSFDFFFNFSFFVLFVFKFFQLKQSQEKDELYLVSLSSFVICSLLLFWLSKKDIKEQKVSLKLVFCLVVFSFISVILGLNRNLFETAETLGLSAVDFALLGFVLAFLLGDFLTAFGNFLAKNPSSYQGIRSLLLFLFVLLIYLLGLLNSINFFWQISLSFFLLIFLDFFFFEFLYKKVACLKKALDYLVSKFWLFFYLATFYSLVGQFLETQSRALILYLLSFSFFYLEFLRAIASDENTSQENIPSVWGGGDILVLSGIGLLLGPLLLIKVLLLAFFFLFLLSLLIKFCLFTRLSKNKEKLRQSVPFVPLVAVISLFLY